MLLYIDNFIIDTKGYDLADLYLLSDELEAAQEKLFEVIELMED
jgi:hypothetical protein